VDNMENRLTAIGALGFSADEGVLNALLNALRDPKPDVRNSAALALGELKDPRTPPRILGTMLEDMKEHRQVRRNVSRAMRMLQEVYAPKDRKQITPFWLRELERPIGEHEPGVLINTIVAVGLLRDPQFAKYVEKYVSHPTPFIRQMTAMALGRMGNESSVEPLLALLGPGETNPNVRLFARKALQALAGGTDWKYNVEQWRATFDRR